MNVALILQLLGLAEQLFTTASQAYATIKADLDASTQAQVDAALASSSSNLAAAIAQLDADAK